jgi:DnaA family protein
MSQMALPLQLADHAVFESFLPAGNEMLVSTLEGVARGSVPHGCWIWGPAATGKTHLLQATCERAGDRSAYVPLRLMADAGPEILEGLTSRELICLDDLDAVAGDAAWEAALFGLCNAILDADRTLVVSAGMSPRESRITLPDLKSRLSLLAVFQLHALTDEQRVQALQLRAGHRGLELPDDTAGFLLNRSRRDMASLYELLDRLDHEALRAQRRLTIPFVRQVLSGRF